MIHQYKLNGYNIVLDTFSGAVHTVDDLVYAILEQWESTPKEQIVQNMLVLFSHDETVTQDEILDAMSDIEELIAAKQLFTPDIYASRAFDLKKRSTVVKALCLHVAHTCNLNCDYCFACQGKYQGERALMSLDVAKRAIDFLIERSGHRKNLEVDFFGGEPLLNFQLLKDVVAYAREKEKLHNKNFRFTLTTNGMLVNDDVIDFANKECDNVVLSLDGRKITHDRFRKTIGGVGSYDIIVPKFKRFIEKRGDKSYYIRGTYTHNNTDFTKDIFHMADLGFTELAMEPVICAPTDPYALTEADLPILYEQYEILMKEMLKRKQEGKPFHFYHYLIDLERGPCIYKRISGCGAGTEYMAVTPWGELYPCHQFVTDKDKSMGNLWDGVTNTELRDEFKLCNAYARPKCQDCWAKLYCSGGCAANACHATGSITGTFDYECKLFRKRIECALMLKVAEQELGLNNKTQALQATLEAMTDETKTETKSV